MIWAGEKKCRPITLSGCATACGDFGNIEIGGVGRKDRLRFALHQKVLAKDIPFDIHVLEHGLDHQICIRKGSE